MTPLAGPRAPCIRVATVPDTEAVGDLLQAVHESFGEPAPPRERARGVVEAALSGESALEFVVAEDEGRLVGILSLAYCPSTQDAAPFAWLDDLHVVEGRRRQGVARALVAFARVRAGERGAMEIRLSADASIPARSLLRGAGFRPSPLSLLTCPTAPASDPAP